MYKQDVLPENAIRSPASEAQGEMAVLSSKNTLVVGLFFSGIFKKWLAQSIRNVGESNIDIQTYCMWLYTTKSFDKEHE